MKYLMSWTRNGARIENQIFTAEAVSRALQNLEAQGATDIEVKSISSENAERIWKLS